VDNAPQLLLNVKEAGALLGVSRSRVFRLIGSGELESIRIGGLRKIPTQSAYDIVERKLAEARDAVA
jgi:excisionase family DNA binding protein